MASEDKLRALQSLAHHLADRFHAHREDVIRAYEEQLRRVQDEAQRIVEEAVRRLREAPLLPGVAVPVRRRAAAEEEQKKQRASCYACRRPPTSPSSCCVFSPSRRPSSPGPVPPPPPQPLPNEKIRVLRRPVEVEFEDEFSQGHTAVVEQPPVSPAAGGGAVRKQHSAAKQHMGNAKAQPARIRLACAPQSPACCGSEPTESIINQKQGDACVAAAAGC